MARNVALVCPTPMGGNVVRQTSTANVQGEKNEGFQNALSQALHPGSVHGKEEQSGHGKGHSSLKQDSGDTAGEQDQQADTGTSTASSLGLVTPDLSSVMIQLMGGEVRLTLEGVATAVSAAGSTVATAKGNTTTTDEGESESTSAGKTATVMDLASPVVIASGDVAKALLGSAALTNVQSSAVTTGSASQVGVVPQGVQVTVNAASLQTTNGEATVSTVSAPTATATSVLDANAMGKATDSGTHAVALEMALPNASSSQPLAQDAGTDNKAAKQTLQETKCPGSSGVEGATSAESATKQGTTSSVDLSNEQSIPVDEPTVKVPSSWKVSSETIDKSAGQNSERTAAQATVVEKSTTARADGAKTKSESVQIGMTKGKVSVDTEAGSTSEQSASSNGTQESAPSKKEMQVARPESATASAAGQASSTDEVQAATSSDRTVTDASISKHESSSTTLQSAVHSMASSAGSGDSLGGTKLQYHQGQGSVSLPTSTRSAETTATTHATTLLSTAQAHDVVDQVIKGISVRVGETTQEMRIALKPESLGNVVLQVKMEDGQMQARIDVTQPAVKAAVEAQMTDLRQALQANGINVDRIDVVASSQSGTVADGDGSQRGQWEQHGSRRHYTEENEEQTQSSRSLGYNTLELTM